MKPIEYFDLVADEYNKERSSGIHGYFAKKEMKVILEFLDVKKGEKILDAGCGSGLYSKIIKNLGGKPYGIDLSKKMIENLKKNKIQGKVANIEKFNLKKKFDKILCVGAFEFLENPKKAAKCIGKHLKINGKFILLYPRISIFGLLYFCYHFLLHKIKIKLYTKRKMKEILKEGNLLVSREKNPDQFTKVIIAKLK